MSRLDYHRRGSKKLADTHYTVLGPETHGHDKPRAPEPSGIIRRPLAKRPMRRIKK